MRTTKVLDTTAISAMLFEIPSVDVLERCGQSYELITAPKVMTELRASKRTSQWDSSIQTVGVEKAEKFDPTKLAIYLAKRYPGLHEGEIAAYLVALNRSILTGRSTVYVTDDGLMRKRVVSIANEKMVTAALGSRFIVKDTGTVGVVLRLRERGMITGAEGNGIADDLTNSSFHCSDDILNMLRS